MLITFTPEEVVSATKVMDLIGPAAYAFNNRIGLMLNASTFTETDGSMTVTIPDEAFVRGIHKVFMTVAAAMPYVEMAKSHFSMMAVQIKPNSDLNRAIKKHMLKLHEKYAAPHVYQLCLHTQADSAELVLVDKNVDSNTTTQVGESIAFGEFDHSQPKAVTQIGTFHDLGNAKSAYWEARSFALNYARAHGTSHIASVILAMYGQD